jgi:LPXTG-site transpeptidase (sortase) family protein
MTTWNVIYEYNDGEDMHRQQTVVIHALPAVPRINLLSGTILSQPTKKTVTLRMPIPVSQFLGFALLALGIGGVVGPLTPTIRLEGAYIASQAQLAWKQAFAPRSPIMPKSAPVVFEPLKTPDGSSIDPVNNDFALIVPEVGINAPVVADVDPTQPAKYADALNRGIAHAATSFLPNEDGTVYLFSHSTNFDWFVKDLNAIFYVLKNLEKDDLVVLMYKGKRYTYKITDKKVVSPASISYLVPTAGKRNLILQTCWPPGSVAERLLIFADLIEEQGKAI